MTGKVKTLEAVFVEGMKGRFFNSNSPFFAGVYEVVDVVATQGIRVRYVEGGRGYQLLPFVTAFSSQEVPKPEKVQERYHLDERTQDSLKK